MDRAPLNFGFSPCPNDTFAFHALVHGLVPGPRVVPHIDDVEALNARAERGEADVTKISIAAYDRIRDRYALLRAGGAAGFGVGPIVVARTARRVGGRIAVPGERTTAALLLNLLGPVRHRADAVRSDRAGCAARRGGLRRADPRGAIYVSGEGSDAARRSRRSVGSANEVPVAAGGDCDPARPGRRARGQRWIARFAPASNTHSRIPTRAASMSRSTRRKWTRRWWRKHIQLYVNDYTITLDERAVHRAARLGSSNRD